MPSTHTIRTLLLADWDPIGIADEPRAQDEYDAYIGPILRLLAGSEARVRVSDYLMRVERERMGLAGDQDCAARVAGRLLELGLT
jgi:hypothetical protein